MNNDFKKGFLTGSGGLLGVLSIPVGIYLIYFLIKLLFVPTTNLLLRKTEYLNWKDCLKETQAERSYQLIKRGYRDNNISAVVQLQKEYCGRRPNEWKWQLETYYKPSK